MDKHSVEVCEFGDISIGKMTVGTFQGTKPTISISDDSNMVSDCQLIITTDNLT